ncbi:MAG: 16S rRNA (guanine(527)-N(7))-methyltransferase RsmG [Bacteroidetes bacterium]|nr:16S rRNA (guanine(527)-N(7))-methyltransferase RsmG [Bacteroidota bacterium]MBK9540773.1 16S rRNA (guanine(527)-N(7))-methyltransferase RsmG [Bacteroidota bacterium]MBP6402713.1 16S rRNA (guanine(527)-N(7))-methyltransferase RsmG [Bacteroidia bacterium]
MEFTHSDIILHYFPSLSAKQQEQFNMLGSLYKEWNEKINVISRKDIENLYINHVLHSLGIAKVISFVPGTSILDVGTGGGFPGIPLAILFPDVKFHLVDSIGKKITVVQEISAALGLQNVAASKARAEELDESFDFVVSRAVTSLSEFHGWVNRKIKPGGKNVLRNGILYLKGGDLSQEIKELGKQALIFNLNTYFKEEFFETKKVVYVSI